MDNLEKIANEKLAIMGIEGSVKLEGHIVMIRVKEKYLESAEKYVADLAREIRSVYSDKTYFIGLNLEPIL